MRYTFFVIFFGKIYFLILKEFTFEKKQSTLLGKVPLDSIIATTVSVVLVVVGGYNLEGMVDAVQTSKFLLFSYAIIISAGLVSVIWVFNVKSKNIRITFLDLALLVVCIYIYINRYLFSTYVSFSIQYYELLGLVAFYIILRIVSKNYYIYLYLSLIMVGVIESLHGILQLYGFLHSNNRNFKVTGCFFNPGPYAGFLSSILIVAIGLYMFKHQKILRGISILGIVAIMLILPTTYSRAAILSVAISIIYLILTKNGVVERIKSSFLRSKKSKLAALTIATIISIGIVYSLYHINSQSANGRILVWRVTSNMIEDKLWLGCGYDGYKANYMNYQASYFYEHNGTDQEAIVADNNYFAFNEYLLFLSENGIIGLSLLIAVGVFLLQSQSIAPVLIIAKAGLLSLLIFSVFSYPSQILLIKLCAVLFIAIISSYSRRCFKLNLTDNKFKKALSFFGVSLIVIIGVLYFEETIALHRGFIQQQSAYILYENNSPQAAANIYHSIYNRFYNDGTYLMSYGHILSLIGEHKTAIYVLKESQKYLSNNSIEIALGNSYKALCEYDSAEAHYQKAHYMVPNRFYPQYLLAKLYDEFDKHSDAIKVANALLHKKAKVESTAIKEMKNEMELILRRNAALGGY